MVQLMHKYLFNPTYESPVKTCILLSCNHVNCSCFGQKTIHTPTHTTFELYLKKCIITARDENHALDIIIKSITRKKLPELERKKIKIICPRLGSLQKVLEEEVKRCCKGYIINVDLDTLELISDCFPNW